MKIAPPRFVLLLFLVAMLPALAGCQNYRFWQRDVFSPQPPQPAAEEAGAADASVIIFTAPVMDPALRRRLAAALQQIAPAEGDGFIARPYTAASGRPCMALIAGPAQPSYLACQSAEGWVVKPSLMPADLFFNDAAAPSPPVMISGSP